MTRTIVIQITEQAYKALADTAARRNQGDWPSDQAIAAEAATILTDNLWLRKRLDAETKKRRHNELAEVASNLRTQFQIWRGR